MFFYSPRKSKDDNMWYYTCHSDSKNIEYPIGYCAEWLEPKLMKDGGFYTTRKSVEEQLKRKPEYDICKGHTTKEEASACYRKFLLNTSLHFYKKSLDGADTHHKCDIENCNKMTASTAVVDNGRVYHLCGDHLNKEQMEILYPEIHESLGS